MQLTADQRRMLDGEGGRAARRAMEILVALGEVFAAERLLPVSSVQVAGVSYGNIGEEGLSFLEELAVDGHAVVPSTLNPAGMDLDRPERMGLPAEFIANQRRVVDAYRRLGIAATCTCTPYLAGNLPAPGDTLAWSESSAVTYANSVLAARTNREGGPSALAAALTGFTPAYGLHLDPERRPLLAVRVEPALRGAMEWGVLGQLIGQRSEGRVTRIEIQGRPGLEELKALSAALPTYGGAPLFHLAGITPEADRHPLPTDTITISTADLREVVQQHRESCQTPSLVCLGCPHATLAEVSSVAGRVAGRKLEIDLWVFTSRPIKAMADELGLTKTIEQAGGQLFTDTCFAVSPLRDRHPCIATDSAKGIYYASGHGGLLTCLLTTAECVETALSGRLP